MSMSMPRALTERLRSLEGRLDAWAARRLSAEEYAEALALDKRVKPYLLRLVLAFVAIAALIALIVVGLRPDTGFGKAFVFSSLGMLYVSGAAISAWYGYRKWIRHPVWKIFLTLVLMVMAGGTMGYLVATIGTGHAFSEIGVERSTRAAAITLLLGLIFAALLVGVSRIRLRDAAQTAARLQAEAERERLARQGTQAELKLLQAQVEPHFLFNTLANVRYLVQSGSPDALSMLDHLIVYLRTALPEMRSESSTLGREAELARAYLEIMRIRMGGALEFAIDIPDDLAPLPFPALMLITLVENAIKHGVAPLGRGKVVVHAKREGDVVSVDVEDDGRGLVEPAGRGVGLVNVRARLRALFGDAAFIALEPRDGGGTHAFIRLPA